MTFAVAALLTVAAHAGITVTWEVPPRAGVADAKPRTVNIQIDGQKLRVGSSDPTQQFMIWDGETQMFTAVKPTDKTFRRMSEADLEKIKANVEQMRKMMEQRLAALPPEKRAQFQAAMGDHGMPTSPPQGPMKFAPTGKKAKVASYDCDVQTATRDDSHFEICVVPWAKAPVKLEELKPLLNLSDKLRGFGMTAHTEQSVGAEGFERDLSEFPGFPAQITRPQSDGTFRVSTLKGVTRAPINADVFAVPEGYTEDKNMLGPTKTFGKSQAQGAP